MADVPSLVWAKKVKELLEASPEFRTDGRALTGQLFVYDNDGGLTFRFDRGAIIEIRSSEDPLGSRYRLGGPRRAWDRALGKAVNLDVAGGFGLALEGDLLGAAGNAMAFLWIWQAMKQAAKGATKTQRTAKSRRK
jgi:hypothetical protein